MTENKPVFVVIDYEMTIHGVFLNKEDAESVIQEMIQQYVEPFEEETVNKEELLQELREDFLILPATLKENI